MARARKEASIVDVAFAALLVAHQTVRRRAQSLATGEEVHQAHGLVVRAQNLLDMLDALAHKVMPDEELPDLVFVRRLSRTYDLLLWETAPQFLRPR